MMAGQVTPVIRHVTALTPASLFLVILLSVTPVSSQRRYTHDLTIKYFSDASMLCDHPDLNISQSTTVRSMTWVFPNGELIKADSYLNPRKFILSGLGSSMDAYNLTALQVQNDVYGYYTCVVVFTSTTEGVVAIRWGLNVDGADYSDLIETYKENAMIGGITAGVFFVLVATSCLIWNLRFNKRSDENAREDKIKDDEIHETSGVRSHVYGNGAYENDGNVAETKLDGGVKEDEMTEITIEDYEPEVTTGDPNFKIARYHL